MSSLGSMAACGSLCAGLRNHRAEQLCSPSIAAIESAPSCACFRRRSIAILAWSRTDYLLDEGITSTASVGIERVERLGQAQETSMVCRIAGLQHAASAHLLALPAAMRHLPAAVRLSDDDAVMLAAMTTGDRTYLTHTLRVGFERTGSFHMLVVSGFHLAIVAGCILWTARRLRLPRVPATLLTIAASFADAFFTGFATPVQRSL